MVILQYIQISFFFRIYIQSSDFMCSARSWLKKYITNNSGYNHYYMNFRLYGVFYESSGNPFLSCSLLRCQSCDLVGSYAQTRCWIVLHHFSGWRRLYLTPIWCWTWIGKKSKGVESRYHEHQVWPETWQVHLVHCWEGMFSSTVQARGS